MKKMLSFLLCLCMLVTMIVVPSYAITAEQNQTDSTQLCPCGCGETLNSLSWEKWDPNTNGAPSSGHYYLTGDYVQKTQQEIMAGDRVVLDLRGHTITSEGYGRLLLVYGRMHVLDTLGGGRFMSKTSGGAYGGVVMVSTNETNDSIFELCSGTIMPDADNKGSRRGGLIHLSETATFRMTGGVLMNGSTISISNPDKKEPGGLVAGINAACTIEILGGKLIGGTSATYGGNIYNIGTTILKNCEIIGGTSTKSGGNICQNGGSLTIENCVISSGISYEEGNGGGNICAMSGVKLRIADSTIRNGWSRWSGGNLFLGTASTVIENTKLEAGVSQNRGNNLYGSAAATDLTIRNCDLVGDITYIGSNLKLEGKVKIGILNDGLRLYIANDLAKNADFSGLTEGSEIYLDAKNSMLFEGANPAYFKGALRTVITPTEDGFTAALAASGQPGGYCPHCNQQVTWKEFSLTGSLVQNCLNDKSGDTDPACTGRHLESGHYFLNAHLSNMAQQYVGIYLGGALEAKDVVIDLAGYDISATGRPFYLRPGSTTVAQSSLTLLDSYGSSMITGRGANNQGGGVIYNEGSKLTIYGGSYIYNPTETPRNVTIGGVVINGGIFTMHGGTLDGSAYSYTVTPYVDNKGATVTPNYYGGALACNDGSSRKVTMTAGFLIGGTAQSGGCVYFAPNNVINITGGQFIGGEGSSASGGNFRMAGTSTNKSAKLTVSGVAIRDGVCSVTSTGGGNMSLGYGTATFENCYIEGGTAAAYGGNMTVGTSGTITFKKCIIDGGTAATQGGNIHVSATSAKLTLEECWLMNGTTGTYGGNLNAGNGVITVTGGLMAYGTAKSYGGNLNLTTGNASASNKTVVTADDAGNAPLFAGGTSGTYGGNICAQSVLELQAARFAGGTAATMGKDLYLSKPGTRLSLTVGAGVTGDVSMGVNEANLTETVYGDPIAHTVCDALNARVTLEGDYKNALLCAKDGTLYVGSVALFGKDGSVQWYTDATTAAADATQDSYVRLYTPQDIVLSQDCAVDIGGYQVRVSGGYTLYGMDSSGDGFTAPTGLVTAAPETVVAQEYTAPDGRHYVTTGEEDGSAFHRVQLQITQVSLRPSADGLYYTGAWGCDETIATNVESYGMAVSTVNMPGKDFAADPDTLYTQYGGAELVGGQKKPGVLISGILKEERSKDLNSAYGQMPVCAVPYMTMKDGSVVLGNETAYSLHSLLQTLDQLVKKDPIGYRRQTLPLRGFYEKWENAGMGDWGLNNIPKPADDGVIDVLMIGSSFCYYYVEELVAVAEAAGIPMRVCNLYYSGCKLEWHYTWWQQGKSNYQFFDTTAFNKRVMTGNVSLEWGLAQDDWDVISIQQSTSSIAGAGAEAHFEATKTQRQTLITYLKEQFPEAMVCWHQPWCHDRGMELSGGTVVDAAWQDRRWESIRTYAVMTAEEMDVQRICSGDAWKYFRDHYVDGEAQLPDTLCKRLGKSSFNGKPDSGDGYHDGDIGGGQLLNAYVWFEIITGESCLGNTFRPTYANKYTLDETLVLALQDCAHQAVLQLRADEAAG